MSKVGRNNPCPCGSGKQYKKCCGSAAGTENDPDRPVLKSVNINNFKCFKKIEIKSLSRVNLITGKNSVGKTAALEAMFLLAGVENLGLILPISQLRGIGALRGDIKAILELLWAPLFHNLEIGEKIQIKANLNTGKNKKVEISLISPTSMELDSYTERSGGSISRKILEQKVADDSGAEPTTFQMKFVDGRFQIEPLPSEPPYPGYFLTSRFPPSQEEIAYLFGRLAKSKKLEDIDLANIMRIVEPRLKQMDVIPSAGLPMIYGDIGLDQMLPISLMGDGLERITGILLKMANAQKGVVLIDEIENGLHHSILKEFWEIIDRAAREFNTQVIATTHSYECIREAHSAFCKSVGYDFSLHRLDRVEDGIDIATYDQEALEAAVKTDFEIR